MDEPIASTSQGQNGRSSTKDLFASFFEPLQQVARATRLRRRRGHDRRRGEGEEEEEQEQDEVDYLDPDVGLAAAWGAALERRLVGTGDQTTQQDDDIELDEENRQAYLLEQNTWALLQALYIERTTPTPDPSSLPSSSVSIYTPPLTIIQRAISSDPALSELSVIRDWLHNTAYSRLHPAEIRKGYLTYTKNKLKQALRTSSDIGTLVDSLDPDATNRNRENGRNGGSAKVLDSEDTNYEKALLRSLWEYVRVGELDQAIDMCRQSDYSWRAASLSGGKLYEDEHLSRALAQSNGQLLDDEMQLLDAESRTVQGNLKRKLWKSMCRSISSSSILDPYEKALYGAISGQIDPVLPVCESWEDHLWVRVNALLEEEIDTILVKQEDNYFLNSSDGSLGSSSSDTGSNRNTSQKKNIPSAMQDIFNGLLANPRLRLDSRSPFHVAQSWIVLNRINDLLTSFVGKLEENAESLSEPQLAHLLRFFAHLIIFLRLVTSSNPQSDLPELPEDASSAILEAYIRVLQSHSEPAEIIAFYSASLEEAAAIEAYSRYLCTEYSALSSPQNAKPAPERSERQRALLLSQENGLDLASVARRVVELTLADLLLDLPDFDANNASFGLVEPRGSTDKEIELIRSVEWLTFDQTTYADALVQANALMRFFLCAGSSYLARKITFQIPPDLLAVVSAAEDAPGVPRSIASAADDQINEYLDYASFFGCLELHNQFSEIWSRRPAITANKSERMQYAEGLKTLTDGLYDSIVDLLTSDWLMLDGAITEAVDLDSQRRRLELQRIKSAYVPELVFRLHHALLDSSKEFIPSNIQKALELANIVADERYKLYAEFLGDGHSGGSHENKLKDYMDNVRDASLAALERGSNPFAVKL